MKLPKSIAPVATALSLIANSTLPATQAAARPSPATAAVSQRSNYICASMDIEKMPANDFIGLLTWKFSCAASFATTRGIGSLERATIADIYLARYSHVYKRPGPINPLLSQWADEQVYVDAAVGNLETLREMGLDQKSLAIVNKVIDDTQQFIKTPVATKIDPSKGTACFLDDNFVGDLSGKFSEADRQKMIKATFICAEAYNERPIALLANQYASTVFQAAKYIAVTHPGDQMGLRAAYVARDFFKRAAKDGMEYEDAMALNEQVILKYQQESQRYNQALTNAALFAVGIFAVGIAINSGYAGVAVFKDTPSVAALAATRNAAQSVEAQRFLAWRLRAEAALPGVSP